MRIAWSPVTPAFGARIEGLDITAPLSTDQQEALLALWRERGLLLFPECPLTPDAQVQLTAIFGEPEVHPAKEAWVDGWPQLSNIRYAPDKRDDTTIYLVDGRELANWQPWHIDTIYTRTIDRGGILHALQVPESGADTGYIDRAEIYDLMPTALRRRAEGKRVRYRLNPIASANPFYPPGAAQLVHKPARIAALQARVARDFPIVSHPIFFTHPETGRPTFNITAMHAIGIEDMDREEGDALLRELVAFSLSGGSRYFHRWRVGDTILWDNWRFLHSAEGTPTTATRRLRRSAVIGDYGLGQFAAPDAQAEPATA